jgi:hypothetical protein
VRHGRNGCEANGAQLNGGLPGQTHFGPWLKVTPVFKRWRSGFDMKDRGRDEYERQWRRQSD